MSSAEKKYRRTRRVVAHANPLFDTWLLEWQEEAGKRDSKMKYNFQRVSGNVAKRESNLVNHMRVDGLTKGIENTSIILDITCYWTS